MDNVRAVYPQLVRELDVGRGGGVLDNVLVFAQSGTVLRPTLGLAWPLARGVGITARDIEEANPVAVVGPTVRDKLFGPDEEPLGAHVQLGGATFEIKGVLGPYPAPADIYLRNNPTAAEVASLKAQFGTAVFLPFRTAVETLFGAATVGRYMAIVVETVDPTRARETARAIRDLIVRTHGREGVIVEVDATLADAYARVTGLSAATLAGVGVVALLGTALVVMTTMLTVVDARKQEIGLRMAFGARHPDILAQFLGEAVLVAVAGGAVGAAAGYLAGPYLSSLANLPFAGEPWFAGAGLVCAAAAGMLAGAVRHGGRHGCNPQRGWCRDSAASR